MGTCQLKTELIDTDPDDIKFNICCEFIGDDNDDKICLHYTTQEFIDKNTKDGRVNIVFGGDNECYGWGVKTTFKPDIYIIEGKADKQNGALKLDMFYLNQIVHGTATPSWIRRYVATIEDHVDKSHIFGLGKDK